MPAPLTGELLRWHGALLGRGSSRLLAAGTALRQEALLSPAKG
jgi:hypothetical protein